MSRKRYTPPTAEISTAHGDGDGTGRSWIDLYAPTLPSELAINDKRISTIRAALSSPQCGILYLYGEAGVCKSTALRVIASELGCSILQYRDDVSGDSSYNSIDSICEFLFESVSVCSLSLSMQARHSPRRCVLVDDFDSIQDAYSYNNNKDRLGKLYSVLSSFASRPSSSSVVCIITTTTMPALPSIITDNAGCTVVNLTSIGVRAATAAMKRVLECSRSLCSINLQHVYHSCEGDLRNAIMTLEFMCRTDHRINQEMAYRERKANVQSQNDVVVISDSDDDSIEVGLGRKKKPKVPEGSGRIQKFSKVPSRTSSKFKDMSRDHLLIRMSSDGCSFGRSQSLGLFHFLGKILYAKRDESGNLMPELLDPEGLMTAGNFECNETVTYLHEHYMNMMCSIEEISSAADSLSTSSYLDVWGLDDYVAPVAMRGIIHARATPMPGQYQSLNRPVLFNVQSATRSWKEFINQQVLSAIGWAVSVVSTPVPLRSLMWRDKSMYDMLLAISKMMCMYCTCRCNTCVRMVMTSSSCPRLGSSVECLLSKMLSHSCIHLSTYVNASGVKFKPIAPSISNQQQRHGNTQQSGGVSLLHYLPWDPIVE